MTCSSIAENQRSAPTLSAFHRTCTIRTKVSTAGSLHGVYLWSTLPWIRESMSKSYDNIGATLPRTVIIKPPEVGVQSWREQAEWPGQNQELFFPIPADRCERLRIPLLITEALLLFSTGRYLSRAAEFRQDVMHHCWRFYKPELRLFPCNLLM